MKVVFNFRGAGGFIKVLVTLGLTMGFGLGIFFYFFNVYHGAYAIFNYL